MKTDGKTIHWKLAALRRLASMLGIEVMWVPMRPEVLTDEERAAWQAFINETIGLDRLSAQIVASIHRAASRHPQ